MRPFAYFLMIATALTLGSGCRRMKPCRPGTVLIAIPCPDGFVTGVFEVSASRDDGETFAPAGEPLQALCSGTLLELRT
jgi:hypothetical protein